MESFFQDEILLENFYVGAGRGELLAQMKDAVEKRVPLMVISGGEGNGKTMMCRMLEKECQASVNVVFFPDTVESFEDVVKIVARKLGLERFANDEGKTIDAVMEQIITHLSQQMKGLLIIFDDAEDIYLATLERIRKMLDRITAAGVRMQILFSGRKTFLENCEQLSICDFRNTENLFFNLLPLTEPETADYLRICSERLTSLDKRKVFNDEVVRNIHGLAKGNFRKIALLADESLRSHGDDTSFMVLLDSVQDEAEAEAEEDKREHRPQHLNRSMPSLWWMIGGAFCILFLVFLLFRPKEISRQERPELLSSPSETAKRGAVAQSEEGQQPTGPPAPHEITPSVVQNLEVLAKQPEKQEQKVPQTSETEPPVTVKTLDGSSKTEEVVEQSPAMIPPVVNKEVLRLPVSVPNKVVTTVEVKVPTLRQIPPLKRAPATAAETTTGAAKVTPRTEVKEDSGANGQLTIDQLYQKRATAASAWARGEKNDKFTVQLMVLTAKNAELNLKKMLAQPNYRQEAGNFYIFKKNGLPEVVLVFYGEYPTIELARIAQNNLPPFLRDHQPYAISVKGAIAKVEK
jgi:type II secretory pathway predicted ATPase ExeA/septal ring-binding cell division protein DamX